MRCGEDVDGTELAFVGRETFARMFEKSTRSWRRMRRTARESAARVVETRESKRPAPLRPGDPNIARMIAAMAAAATDGSRRRRMDGGGGAAGGLAAPSHAPHAQPAAGPFAPAAAARGTPERGPDPHPRWGDTCRTSCSTRRSLRRRARERGTRATKTAIPATKTPYPGLKTRIRRHRGDETPRERRAGVAGRGGVVRSAPGREGREEERRARFGATGRGVRTARDLNRPVRRREPLGPDPRGPTRLARLVAALESHPAFEGAERAVLSAAARDMESLVVPPGKPLYRHGAKGDYLYVVEAGTLDVMAPNPEGVGSPRTTERSVPAASSATSR